MIRIAVTAANGRMGQTVLRRLLQDKSGAFMLAAAQARAVHHATLFPMLPADCRVADSLDEAIDNTDVDVVIDFSLPEFSLQVADACTRAGHALVCGTTGFSPREQERLMSAAETIPLLHARNMSVGVNLLLHEAAEIAARLPQATRVLIKDIHHQHKRDAPSGTALALAEAIATAKGGSLRDFTRLEAPENADNLIRFHSIREGETIGEHEVIFEYGAEQIMLRHRADSRDVFADGALMAARWLASQKPGFYSMKQVLGL